MTIVTALPPPGAERMTADGISMNDTNAPDEAEIEPPPIEQVQQLLDQIEDALEKVVTTSGQPEHQ